MKRILDNKILRIILSVLVIVSLYFVPSLFAQLFLTIGVKNKLLLNLISLLSYAMILILIFLPELKSEFKIFKANYKSCLDNGFKYWLVGLVVMIAANIIINFFIIGDIAANEELNRKAMLENPIWYTLLVNAILAPLLEEIIFRKSTDKIFDNPIYYYALSGLLFGFAHTIADLSSALNLLYIIPYGSLGVVFAIMDKKTNTTFSSIIMHSMHNFIVLMLLLMVL